MRDDPVATPLSLFGFSHKIKYQPKGVVLIIAPWNFPVNLSLMPVVSAIAAGNAIIIKPSEHTPHSSAILDEIISDIYPEDEVSLLQGGIPETTYLLKKPFNHIFFTGAPAIGKIVMKAASEHLASVSLELGGKSPTIVDASANIKSAAKRIAWAKSLNNGQICIAPDYVMIHESVKEKFLKHYAASLQELYGNDIASSESYGRIVSDRHFDRLVSYLDDAKALDATILMGGHHDAAQKFIEPTVVTDLPESAMLMQEEIFGPILPIKTFKHIDETIDYINQGENPLALYIYSSNKKNTDKIIEGTRSGGVVTNYSTTHYTNPNLPFGGVNNSGLGKTNGYFGFKAFSNLRAIQKKQTWNMDIVKLLYPPYNLKKLKLTKLITKYFA